MIPEHAEERRPASGHDSSPRPSPHKPAQDGPERGAVRDAGLLQVISQQGRAERAGAPRQGRRAFAPRAIEPAVRLPRADGEGGIGGVDEHEIERRHARRREPLAAAARPGRPGPEEERDVRADRERDLGEGAAVVNTEGAGEDAEDGGGVGGAAAEAGRHGDALRDPDRDRAVEPEPLPEERRRARGEVLRSVELRPAWDGTGDRAGAPRDPDVHLVGEVERRHEREKFVVAVRTSRADAQDEVHLRRGEGREAHPHPLP